MWDHMCVKCVNIRLHRNSDAQVGTGLAEPESEKIFPSCIWSWQWSGLFCAPSFAVCCYLGLMMWFVISKESSRNWDQAATLWNKTLSLCRKAAGETWRHLFSSRLFVSVFIFLCHSSPSHISLFLSILTCQKTVKILMGTGKAQHVQAKVEGVRKPAGAPGCSVC